MEAKFYVSYCHKSVGSSSYSEIMKTLQSENKSTSIVKYINLSYPQWWLSLWVLVTIFSRVFLGKL